MKATIINATKKTPLTSTITDIEKLTETIQQIHLNMYKGHNLTQPYAWIFPMQNKSISVRIEYDDLIDCKKTEMMLKPLCTTFSPRKYNPLPSTSIGVSRDCKDELNKIKLPYESFEDVIWRLLLTYSGEI